MNKIVLSLVLSFSVVFATTVAFDGKKVILNSNGYKVGDTASMFNAVKTDLSEMTIGGKKDKVQVIAFVPSLDTGVCKLETIAFNHKIGKMKNVILTVVSKDLPFAQARFCKDNKITNIYTVSDYKDANNALRYGATISAPSFLEGFFGRVVYIVDTKGKIAYVQVVKEITKEPNYKEIINALKKIK
ncbi:Thiol peroxidase, Tpx-type [hydrothermal vent metagenome]|uniref:Thiol peroxidase, Tpx-type n=1 Tax=hydrothermal vent metagenome TaxID=652676 RepID=A0A3B1EA49_9ZZZZ